MKVKIMKRDGIIVDGSRRLPGEVVEMPTKRAAEFSRLGHIAYTEEKIGIIPLLPIVVDGEVVPAGDLVYVETARAVSLCLNRKAEPMVAL
jgi:hypothetical protein